MQMMEVAASTADTCSRDMPAAPAMTASAAGSSESASSRRLSRASTAAMLLACRDCAARSSSAAYGAGISFGHQSCLTMLQGH